MYNKDIFSVEDLFMDFSTKNMIKALLTDAVLSIGFYFFFGMKLLPLAILIGTFLSISMFFNPSKLQKARREDEHKANSQIEVPKELDPKEISEEDIKSLGLDDIDIDEDSEK